MYLFIFLLFFFLFCLYVSLCLSVCPFLSFLLCLSTYGFMLKCSICITDLSNSCLHIYLFTRLPNNLFILYHRSPKRKVYMNLWPPVPLNIHQHYTHRRLYIGMPRRLTAIMEMNARVDATTTTAWWRRSALAGVVKCLDGAGASRIGVFFMHGKHCVASDQLTGTNTGPCVDCRCCCCCVPVLASYLFTYFSVYLSKPFYLFIYILLSL